MSLTCSTSKHVILHCDDIVHHLTHLHVKKMCTAAGCYALQVQAISCNALKSYVSLAAQPIGHEQGDRRSRTIRGYPSRTEGDCARSQASHTPHTTSARQERLLESKTWPRLAAWHKSHTGSRVVRHDLDQHGVFLRFPSETSSTSPSTRVLLTCQQP